MNLDEIKIKLMEIALNEAKKAYKKGEVPVGAIIVLNDKIIGKGHNLIQSKKNVLLHAEIQALNKAIKKVGQKSLNEAEMYVSLEPCPMCAGAIILSKIKNIYIATKDEKSGFGGSVYNILNNPNLNHRCNVNYGILENESSTLLKKFFKELRDEKKVLKLKSSNAN